MKKLLSLILVTVTALIGFTACNSGNPDRSGDNGENVITGNGSDESGKGDGKKEEGNPPATDNRDILVVYFSCTNTTEKIAEYIEAKTKGTLYEIVPKTPYTADDLKYYTDCRADREQADISARPAIEGGVENMEKYGVIFIGYPIWHGQAPRIISTFLESYDFSGKTIIPFCTSASSPSGSSDTALHTLAPSAKWLSGKRFSSGTSESAVAEWVESLDINSDGSTPTDENKEITKMYLTINGNKVEVTLAVNSAVDALVGILKEGDVVYTARDYGGFEKVGSMGHTLPSEDTQMTTEAGDVVLYSGNQIVVFYGSNSWSYTRLGKINGYSADELKTLLAADKGSVEVKISLN